MQNYFLKKILNEEKRYNYFCFSEIDKGFYLENYTRVKSFILKNEFEIFCPTWYEIILKILNHLQEIYPLKISYILESESIFSRTPLFVDYPKSGYIQTNFGIYLRRITDTSMVVLAIRKILQLYSVNLSDAYMVVEVAPRYESKECIKYYENKSQEQLLDFLNSTFSKPIEYFDLCIKVIDTLNSELENVINTSYNNLYLLNSLADYDLYSARAFCSLLNNKDFKEERLFNHVIDWLRHARFYKGEIYSEEPKIYLKVILIIIAK